VWALAVASLYLHPVVWIAPKFKAPLSPLLPSLAILSNVFLIASLGVAAYVRFAVWLFISFGFYVVYGVHHSKASVEVGEVAGGEYVFVHTGNAEVELAGVTQPAVVVATGVSPRCTEVGGGRDNGTGRKHTGEEASKCAELLDVDES
jgi:hypothetical protein